MAYQITHTDGRIFVTLGDAVLDNTLGISLIGKNFSNYGEKIGNNFLNLLENQSAPTAPTAPVGGQLWWDSGNLIMKTYDGTKWKSTSGCTVSSTVPPSPLVGDQWWDTGNVVLKIYTGLGGNLAWDNIDSTVSTAGDLAECYTADAQYLPGTVVDFGGDFEVTLSSSVSSTRVAGVISTEPAYLMNKNCAGEFVVSLALQGRCPVMVTGFCQKGDLMVSHGDGTARRHLTPPPGSVIGKALESHNGDPSLIEVVIGKC